MRKPSVDSAASINNGCVIAFPRERTIGNRGATSGASRTDREAHLSAASLLRTDRPKIDRPMIGKASQQAASGHGQEIDLEDFATQNLKVQNLKMAGHSAGSPMMLPVAIDHAAAGSQMTPRSGTYSDPMRPSVAGSIVNSIGGTGSSSASLRKAAAARLVAVANGDIDPARMDKTPLAPNGPQGEPGQHDFSRPQAAGAGLAVSRTADISSYIAHMTQELAQMARGSNLDLLAYFLEMAELEARMRSSSSLQSA